MYSMYSCIHYGHMTQFSYKIKLDIQCTKIKMKLKKKKDLCQSIFRKTSYIKPYMTKDK